MSLEVLLFVVAGAGAVATALTVIAHRRPVVSAFYLVLHLAFVAALFLALGAHFLAAIQVILYAGAIMVLFLFVVMLLNPAAPTARFAVPAGGVAVAAVLAALFAALAMRGAASLPGAGGPPPEAAADAGSAAAVGRVLFSAYLYPFEIASILLLAAMVGAVVLARRQA